MKSKEVLKLLKITRVTLSKYVRTGLIRVVELPNGYYNYRDEDVYKLLCKDIKRKNVIYTRVSSTCQKKDLENQKETLRQFCNKNGIQINEEYSDICSGMNFDRKSFQKMLDEVTDYKIDKIFITYKDRLSRISFQVFSDLFKKYGTEIIVLNEIDNPKETEKEIFEEIISMLHCFSMKMYSKRRKEKIKLIEKDLELENTFSTLENSDL